MTVSKSNPSGLDAQDQFNTPRALSSGLIRKPIVRWFLIAGAFHLAVTVLMNLVATSSHFTSLHNGAGLWNFALDSTIYYPETLRVSSVLSQEGWKVWWRLPVWFHVRLYSLAYHFSGHSLYSAAIVNTPFYIVTLVLVFQMASTLFDRKAGVLACAMVALWPSYLLQSTQILKDTISVPAQLAFLYGATQLLKSDGSWRSLLQASAWSIIGYAGIWQIKFYMTPYYLLLWVFALILGFFKAHKRASLCWKQCAVGFLLLCLYITFGTNSVDRYFYNVSDYVIVKGNPESGKLVAAPELNPPQPSWPIFEYRKSIQTAKAIFVPYDRMKVFRYAIFQPVAAYVNAQCEAIATRRYKFLAAYQNAYSNIDTDVAFKTPADVLAYLPRALVIGFAAPFPNLWFKSGYHTGRIGRIVSGLEMCGIYVLSVLMFIGIWRDRSDPSVIFLSVVILTGLTLHAIVIPNMGCLYRMRYIYWFLMVILASRSMARYVPRILRTKSCAE